MQKVIAAFVLSLFSAYAISEEADLSSLILPEGFQISVFADDVLGARSMARSPSGIVYVGSFVKNFKDKVGKVYAVIDQDRDNRADEVVTILEDMNMPNGIAYRDGDLYVAEIDRVLRYRNIDQVFRDMPEPEIVVDGMHSDFHHGWKFIRFSPEGDLYIPVGAPCNVCDKDEEGYSNIQRFNSKTDSLEVYARGVRNSVGFDWHPQTGELWFTDNGRDLMGDEIPECELNRAPQPGIHFGYPFCHESDVLDPEFGEGKSCGDYQAPEALLGPHTAPLGMRFYTGDMLPAKYRNWPIIALHGSWNRTPEAGHTGAELVAYLGNGQVETLVKGWLKPDNTYWGRPVDIEQMPDGSLLISDDHGDRIFRLSYQ